MSGCCWVVEVEDGWGVGEGLVRTGRISDDGEFLLLLVDGDLVVVVVAVVVVSVVVVVVLVIVEDVLVVEEEKGAISTLPSTFSALQAKERTQGVSSCPSFPPRHAHSRPLPPSPAQTALGDLSLSPNMCGNGPFPPTPAHSRPLPPRHAWWATHFKPRVCG